MKSECEQAEITGVRYEICTDHFVDVKGVRTRYWEAGEGERAVVLVHGLGASLETWVANLEALSGRLRVIAVDMIGFGRTDKPEAEYSYPFLASFLNDFFDAMRLKTASVVGHSLGGGVALQFAIDFPARLERLVLVDSGGLGRDLSLVLRILTLPVVGELLTLPRPRSARQMMAGLVYDGMSVPGEIVTRANEIMRMPGAQRVLLKTLRSVATTQGESEESLARIIPHLGAIRAKTLVVWGRQDRVVPFSNARAALQSIPGAQLLAFDRCGHCPMVEHPDEFNDTVGEFLSAP